MNRSAPLKRTPFKRAEGPTSEKGERPKAKQAKERVCDCGKKFEPRNMAHTVCSQRCAMRKLNRKKAEDKAALRERKAAIKRPTEWLNECKKIVQKIARLRDKHDGCISCHMGPNYEGQWHGSHFRPAGNHSAVELHLWNIHKSCAQCNKYKGGNIAGYRPRLIEKIGVERVEWLEAQNQVTRRTVEYLARFKKVMGKRARRMEKWQ